jgi:glycerophosphoryl diester phosphodiesterase family protein
MALDLRPLTLGELLDRSFSIFRHHFWMFVGIMAVPSVMALALSVLSLLMIAVIPTPDTATGTIEQNPSAAMRTIIWVGTLIIAIFATLVVYFITYAVALGATTVAVSQIYLDRPGTIRSAYAPLKGKVGRLTLLFFLVSLRVFGVAFLGLFAVALFGGFLAVFSPVIGVAIMIIGMLGTVALTLWLVLRYAVSVPAAVLEDESATDAITRSVQLTEDYRGRTFVLVMFSLVIAYAALFIFQGPFLVVAAMAEQGSAMYFWTNMLSSVFGAIGSALTSPLMVVAFAVLYYDLRVRKEGLDLDVMLAKLPAGTRS